MLLDSGMEIRYIIIDNVISRNDRALTVEEGMAQRKQLESGSKGYSFERT